jgi:hypothetical protein
MGRFELEIRVEVTGNFSHLRKKARKSNENQHGSPFPSLGVNDRDAHEVHSTTHQKSKLHRKAELTQQKLRLYTMQRKMS